MSWSWLWDGAPAPPPGDVAASFIATIERKFKSCPPSHPANERHAALRIAGDASMKSPRLSSTITAVTRRALAVLEPDLLHELLTVDGNVRAARSPHTATPRTGEAHDAKWRRLAEAMRSLAAELHVEGMRCTGRDPCSLLEEWAADADERASRSAEAAPALPKHDASIDRARLSILGEVLAASGQRWEDGDLADLIAACRTDWREPPTCLGDDSDRASLSQWIAEQRFGKAMRRAPMRRATDKGVRRAATRRVTR